jgi:hypothetical protein
VSVVDPAKRKVKQNIAFKIAGMRPEPIQALGTNITRDGKTDFVAALGRQTRGRGRRNHSSGH